jgi:microcystin-dependent protein
MANPYLGEIRLVSFNFPPRGWAFCNGQSLAINQNEALFSLMGTYYGGNGTTTFQLPNLQGRVVVHQGTSSLGSIYTQGESAGVATVEINDFTMPRHSHSLAVANKAATASNPTSIALAVPPTAFGNMYGSVNSYVNMPNTTMQYYGENAPHNNMMPYLVLNYVIALIGIYPSRT